MEDIKADRGEPNDAIDETSAAFMIETHNISYTQNHQLDLSFEQIRSIIKATENLQDKISNFTGVFQSNPDYIHLADDLYRNLSVLNKIPTMHITDLQKVKQEALIIVHNSIKSLDAKLKSNFTDYFGRFANSISNNFASSNVTHTYPLECQLCAEHDVPCAQPVFLRSFQTEFHNPSQISFASRSSKKTCLPPMIKEHMTEGGGSSSDRTAYNISDQHKCGETNAFPTPHEESTSPQKETQCNWNDFSDSGASLSERTESQILPHHEFTELKRLHRKFDALLKRLDKNKRGMSAEQLTIADRRLNIIEKVSGMMLQLQVLFVIFIVEIPLLMLFLSVMSWWQKFS